jgi:hypothetical protein
MKFVYFILSKRPVIDTNIIDIDGLSTTGMQIMMLLGMTIMASRVDQEDPGDHQGNNNNQVRPTYPKTFEESTPDVGGVLG